MLEPTARRRSSATSRSSGGNIYVYDVWGNLLQKSLLTNSCAGERLLVSAGENNRISTAGYAYDAAGNMTSDGLGHTFTYDQENRITGAAGYVYVYDADGNRVEKASASSGTLYWYMTPGHRSRIGFNRRAQVGICLLRW